MLALCLLFFTLQCASSQDGPIVATTYGTLEGFSSMDHLNRTYDAFLGVPFAKPPMGDLRWAKPEPPEPWGDVRNSTWWRPHCIQDLAAVYPVVEFSANESEDCLYLNVYVPPSVDTALGGEPLPVMMFFYGGGYNFGTAEMYPGEELATTGDVIVVTTNYRVGMMGFFSTADNVAPGNWGLWDGKAALQWVIDNIGFFGGDANRITLLGQSAGGATTSHFTLSHQTSDMFQRGIAISGSTWHSEPTNSTALYMGSLYDCDVTDTQLVVECLRQIDGKELDQNTSRAAARDDFMLDLGVFIDGFADDPFVDQDLEKSWDEGRGGHIDFITGSTYHDSCGFVTGKLLGIPFPNETNDYNRDNGQLFNQWFVGFSRFDNRIQLLDALYERFPDMNSTDDAVATEECTRVQTDISFGAPSYYQGEKHAASGGGGATYMYVFSHRQSFHGGYPQWCNGSHLDDIYSVLGETFMRYMREELLGEFDADDKTMSNIIMKYYANFAYTGDPNQGPHTLDLQWPTYDLASRRYLLQTATPAIEVFTQAHQEHYNWFLTEFKDLLEAGSEGNPAALYQDLNQIIDKEDMYSDYDIY